MTLSIFLNGVVFLLCFRWFRVNFHMIGFLHVFFWFFAAVWMVGSDSMIQTLSRCTVGKWCLDGEMDPGCHGNTFTGIVNIPALHRIHRHSKHPCTEGPASWSASGFTKECRKLSDSRWSEQQNTETARHNRINSKYFKSKSDLLIIIPVKINWRLKKSSSPKVYSIMVLWKESQMV